MYLIVVETQILYTIRDKPLHILLQLYVSGKRVEFEVWIMKQIKSEDGTKIREGEGRAKG